MDEASIHRNKISNKTYISPVVGTRDGPLRIASKVIDSEGLHGDLSARSVAYSLSVLGALFRWLIEQRYVLVNPFSGIKVRGASLLTVLDAARSFSDAEWALVRQVADVLEWSYGWSHEAAHRLRFVIAFDYATGLRSGELVGQTLRQVKMESRGAWWLHLEGKGEKQGKLPVPRSHGPRSSNTWGQRGLSVIRAAGTLARPWFQEFGKTAIQSLLHA